MHVQKLTRPLFAALALSALTAACSKSSEGGADSASMAASAGAAPAAADTTAGAAATGAQPATAGVVKVASDTKNGTYLTDGSGRALYMFEKDKSGQSACDSACATAWPPYVAQGAATAGDTTVKATMLSTMSRKDGSQQVTYNGMPLYYYSNDAAPGDTKGQDIKAFGADWYLVAPSGKKQEGKDND